VLDDTARPAAGFVDGLRDRRVRRTTELEELRPRLAKPLTQAEANLAAAARTSPAPA
jgi:hypothetical protein